MATTQELFGLSDRAKKWYEYKISNAIFAYLASEALAGNTSLHIEYLSAYQPMQEALADPHEKGHYDLVSVVGEGGQNRIPLPKLTESFVQKAISVCKIFEREQGETCFCEDGDEDHYTQEVAALRSEFDRIVAENPQLWQQRIDEVLRKNEPAPVSEPEAVGAMKEAKAMIDKLFQEKDSEEE